MDPPPVSLGAQGIPGIAGPPKCAVHGHCAEGHGHLLLHSQAEMLFAKSKSGHVCPRLSLPWLIFQMRVSEDKPLPLCLPYSARKKSAAGLLEWGKSRPNI